MSPSELWPTNTFSRTLFQRLKNITISLQPQSQRQQLHYTKMNFKQLAKQPHIYLYAGDMPDDRRRSLPFVGLTLGADRAHHIHHDITLAMSELLDACVDVYQSEDVMEHIEYDRLRDTINEIHRVLKPGGLFRLSVPDYRCDVLRNRCIKDEHGNIQFDPQGGGSYDASMLKVVGGGHVWFPVYENTLALLQSTNFRDINVLHAYTPPPTTNFTSENGATFGSFGTFGTFVCEPIDYTKGFISRTPDHDPRVQSPRRPMSLVVDLKK